MIDELLGLVNHEASSMRLSGDDIGVSISFHLVQNGVKLDGECHGDTSTAVLLANIILVRVHGVVVVVVDNEMALVVLGSEARALGLATALGAGFLRWARGREIHLGHLSAEQALGDHAGACRGLLLGQRDRLAALGGVGNAHGQSKTSVIFCAGVGSCRRRDDQ